LNDDLTETAGFRLLSRDARFAATLLSIRDVNVLEGAAERSLRQLGEDPAVSAKIR